MLQPAELSNEMLVFWVKLSAGCCHVKWPLCASAPAPPLHAQTKHNRIFQTGSHGSNYPINSVQTLPEYPFIPQPGCSPFLLTSPLLHNCRFSLVGFLMSSTAIGYLFLPLSTCQKLRKSRLELIQPYTLWYAVRTASLQLVEPQRIMSWIFASFAAGLEDKHTPTTPGRVCHISPSCCCADDFFSPVVTHKVAPIGSAVRKMLHIPRWWRESADLQSASSQPCFSCVQMAVSKAPRPPSWLMLSRSISWMLDRM